MLYTHIQCIAYQVPTVAKVFDYTMPTQHNLPMPSEAGAPLPQQQQITNGSNTFSTYYIDNGIYYLSQAQNIDYSNGSDFLAWKVVMEPYMHTLMQYLEIRSANHVISQQWWDIIDYLKYYMSWGDWTIPSGSGASGGNAVEIVQDKTLSLLSAYELKDPDANGANLTVLNANTDAKNRVIRFLNVLYEASQNNHIDNSSKTLKVFTAPEFYFRPEATVPNSNIYRAYTETVYKAIKAVLRETIKSGMILNHWLIIPGTIMWYMPAGSQKNTGYKNNPVKTSLSSNTYFNSTMRIYNAPGGLLGLETAQTSHKIEKSAAATMDGVPAGNAWDYGNNAPMVLYKYRSDHHLGKHLFDVNGVKTGLEICLEHIGGFVRFNYQNGQSVNNSLGILKYLTTHKNEPKPDLQLLIAGGMPKKVNSIVLDKDKVFFRNDGYNNAPPDSSYVVAQKATATVTADTDLTNLTTNPVITLNNDDAFKLQPPADTWPIAPDSPVNGTQYLQGKYLPFTDQKIVIYESHKIS